MSDSEDKKQQRLMKKLENAVKSGNLSEKEIMELAKKIKNPNTSVRTHQHRFSNKRSLIGIISDTHIGHKEFKEDLFLKALKYFKREGADAIYHTGDILEGMSGRDGHVYELSHIGADAQLDYAVNLFNESKVPIYAISGNHDDWFMKKADMGLDVGKVLENRVKDFTFLGNQEADVQLAPNTKMKLFHANDGTAYAMSYKMQKMIESFTGGEKPDLVVEGHYHKALYMFLRNVHGVEAGTLCGQTSWMRGRKIQAHQGFWLLDIYHDKKGIERIQPTFFPAYN